MKIVATTPHFSPVTVTIVLESAVEMHVLSAIARADCRIPEMLRNCEDIALGEASICQDILNNLNDALCHPVRMT